MYIIQKINENYLIIFIGETGLGEKINLKKQWGEFKTIQTQVSAGTGGNKSLILAICQYGIIGGMFLDDTIDPYRFCYFLNELSKIMNNDPKFKNYKKLFILDNASIHSGISTKNFLDYLNLEVLFIALYTPQCNPIAHLFSKIKRDLKGQDTHSKYFTFFNLLQSTIKIFNLGNIY